MFQNKTLKMKDKDFFYADIDSERTHQTACFSMSLIGIEKVLPLLKVFSKTQGVNLNSKNILSLEKSKNYDPVSEVLIRYKNLNSENLIVNASDDNKKLYIYCSKKGLDELIDSLICLKKGLEKGNIEDISYMVPDWGGEGLLDHRVLNTSHVIRHLRLYGIR